ncbi:metallophosphoesterase [Chlorobium ferrooxidans]|uniref:Metallophosphoesterase n=1 Tax=Chlorobium ferrooxidans DSM 13031 TaxID=377431 RepID=Q0YRR6_9CHLB|nr:metallophosphoesterase [Chlorobium ferrooxidans]EAT58953.1 Metallophosphoesterase [Chlorobium ferrooxidans DSM 13031]
MKKSPVRLFLIAFTAILSCCSLLEVNAAENSVKGNGTPLNHETTAIPNPNNQIGQIVCISDIHLGIDDSYAECNKNRQPLVRFLNEVRQSPAVRELVIAGDLIDEWFIPAEVNTFNGGNQRNFVTALAHNNQPVINAFQQIINERRIKVTYLPGNHDLLITAGDVQSILPGITQARDVQGLGSYSPLGHPEIVIEHGHRYNFFCAPDPYSNQAIAKGSILPPGYFFTRIATQSVKEGKQGPGGILPIIPPGSKTLLMYEYWKQWHQLMTAFPIKAGLNDKIIKTGIDGYTLNYSINDLVPFQLKPRLIDVRLFKGIATEKAWDDRQKHNRVAVPISARNAITMADSNTETDSQAITQYFTNPASDKRIVIFGHTHDAKIIPFQKEKKNDKEANKIYANSGTWIDSKVDNNNIPIMTFVVVTPGKSGISAESVTLYRYLPDGTITQLATETLTSVKK